MSTNLGVFGVAVAMAALKMFGPLGLYEAQIPRGRAKKRRYRQKKPGQQPMRSRLVRRAFC